jgi:L-threonylcarbamoyladenylate synthase
MIQIGEAKENSMQTELFDLRDTKRPQNEVDALIGAAARILREGGLLGIPTETVYGLGANALNPDAVRRIFEAKGRPQDNPLILHVPGPQWLARYCREVPPIAYELARRFWPGPLTMILKRNPIVPDITTAGLDTVGMRCPNHAVTLAIIREAGCRWRRPAPTPPAGPAAPPPRTCWRI